MSFSSLPPELIHFIISSTVPHTFHSLTYHERQSTLCHLSLVSKLFHSIAQPLLLEIMKLKRTEDAMLPTPARVLEGGVGNCKVVPWLVIEWDDPTLDSATQEEEDRFAESLNLLASARNLTSAYFVPMDYPNLFSTMSQHLTYLQLSYCPWSELSRFHLPHLRDLTLHRVSPELFLSLVDPDAVPNLRNFAFGDSLAASIGHLIGSRLNDLLPQLETLTLSARMWTNPRAAFLRSAASRTLVDFTLQETERLSFPKVHVVHVRLETSSVRYRPMSHDDLQAHLDKWTTLIQNNPTLPLRSVYLDTSLQSLKSFPINIRTSLATLTQTCQERKIDLIFESFRFDCTIDPYISNEFIWRQKERRFRGVKAGGEAER